MKRSRDYKGSIKSRVEAVLGKLLLAIVLLAMVGMALVLEYHVPWLLPAAIAAVILYWIWDTRSSGGPSWWTRFIARRRLAALKRAFDKGRGRLLYAGTTGSGQYKSGKRLLSETFVQTTPGGEGARAWAEIAAHPDRLFLSLSCPCGAVFALACANGYSDIRDPDTRLGSFSDRYRGAWSAPWFRLERRRRTMTCPECRKEVQPRVRLF